MTVHVDNRTGDARTAPAAVVVPVVAVREAVAEVFVGRDVVLRELLARLDPAGGGPGVAVRSAVAGLGGVGKTTLARHAARQAVQRGWCAGGAFLVDLHGYDSARRVEAAGVFDPALRALGVSDADIPTDPGGLAAAYHRHLTALGRSGAPVLLVLDNVSTASQVEDLLPEHAAHRVLITSRHTLGMLAGVTTLDLDVLDVDAAVRLLDQALRARAATDERVRADPAGAARLAGLCDRLPLALRIAAALLADDPDRTVADLADDLADPDNRVSGLTYDERTSLTAVFDLSLRHLDDRDPRALRLLRLLTVNPGPDLGPETVTALAGQPGAVVRRLLRTLRQAHLIEPSATGAGRWRIHDLLGLHIATTAGPNADAEERVAAWRRLTDHYQSTLDAADDHLRALPGDTVSARFTGRADALTWLDAEYPNLLALTSHAATIGDHRTTARLPLLLAEYLSWRRHHTDWITLTEHALTALRELGDRHSESAALANLGLALQEVRRFEEAIDAHQRAAEIARELGDRHGEGAALNNLGSVLQDVRRFEEAIGAHQQAADIARELGERHGEGQALSNLGNAVRQVRWFDDAIGIHQQAAEIARGLGDQHGEGRALNNLGNALQDVRRFGEAIGAHQRAVEIARELGDRHSEGMALGNLGNSLQEVRRFEEAIDAHQQAAEVVGELGDRRREGQALSNLGLALLEVRRFEEAIDAHQQAAGIARELGDRHSEGTALNNLGLALLEVRRFEEAIDAHQQAAGIARELGDRHGEGAALNNLGNGLLAVRRFEEAIGAHQRAAGIARELGDRHSESLALSNLGNALQDVRRFEEAIGAHQQAAGIARELGDRHSEGSALNNLGNGLLAVRRFEEAIGAHQQATDIARELGDRHGEGLALNNLGLALLEVRRFDEAIGCWREALRAFAETGDEHNAGALRDWLGDQQDDPPAR
ncbi:tetratricopeptide repeat protein [Longispora urticae]